MIIALDYDGTYTRDPDLWDAFIALGQARGHIFICVTNRPFPPNTSKAERLPDPAIEIICAGAEFKIDAARAKGYIVSIWIDDMPGTVSQSLLLP